MQFQCDRCGKRYSTAQEVREGRSYRIQCRACGHLITIRVPLSDSVPAAPPPAPRNGTSVAARPGANGAARGGLAMARPTPPVLPPPILLPTPPPPEPTPGSGYFDLRFDDDAPATGGGSVPIAEPPAPRRPEPRRPVMFEPADGPNQDNRGEITPSRSFSLPAPGETAAFGLGRRSGKRKMLIAGIVVASAAAVAALVLTVAWGLSSPKAEPVVVTAAPARTPGLLQPGVYVGPTETPASPTATPEPERAPAPAPMASPAAAPPPVAAPPPIAAQDPVRPAHREAAPPRKPARAPPPPRRAQVAFASPPPAAVRRAAEPPREDFRAAPRPAELAARPAEFAPRPAEPAPQPRPAPAPLPEPSPAPAPARVAVMQPRAPEPSPAVSRAAPAPSAAPASRAAPASGRADDITRVRLRKDVDGLGRSGEVVEVPPGYARNFLLPRGLAVAADGRGTRQTERAKGGEPAEPDEEPVAPGAGYRRPAPVTPQCVERGIRLPRELANRPPGSITLRFAVGRSGTADLVQVMPGPDRQPGERVEPQLVEAVTAAVRGCRFSPGADDQGQPARLWMTMQVRFGS